MNIWTDPELQAVINQRSTDPVDGGAAWGIAQTLLEADPAYKQLLMDALAAR